MTFKDRVGLGRDFNLLWAGQSVSLIGDKINLFVVPTLMIVALQASAFQVGLVSMAQYVAIPVLSLVAGVLVDRWNLRWTLIACDLIRFAAIALIPLAYWLDFLSVPLIFFSVAAVSATSVFFNLAYTATISSIVPVHDRVKAISNLETSRTTSEVVGPAIASGLYALIGVWSLVVDMVTYLVSAAGLRAMRPYGTDKPPAQPMWSRLKQGIRLNWDDRVLRGTLLATLLANIGGPIFVTVTPMLAYRGLGLSVRTFGVVMSVAAVFAVIGALTARKVAAKAGPARMAPWSVFLHSVVGLGILAAPMLPAAYVLGATLSLYGVFMVWYNVSASGVRQERVKPEDQAVSHAAFRTATWGIIPVSVFAGGLMVQLMTPHLGDLGATRLTMVIGTLIGTLFAALPMVGTHALLKREKEAAAEAEAVPA
ncbi:MFS transporter [Actinorhabdospora filicis]|uniref:MFS transporter n=1 Tax=Actinorhabdospora filicis TaxID=1785913 RepID=A0A9W6W6F7_9ACTN|nr:MFS transporter [Actinorhabdospora filicis]GLZ81487.1 MFS transporter [Actinorhabdospora filicis]